MIFNDRVRQYTNTIGTGSYSIYKTVDGFETFANSFTDGDETSYCATDGSNYELGYGIVSGNGLLLSRSVIVRSSNSNAAVDWSAGDKEIFCALSSAFVPIYGEGLPTADINPPIVGAEYIDRINGSIYVCIDNTTDANIWNISGLNADSVATTPDVVALVIALG